VTEACTAGVSVVASDLPIQRQAAERVGGAVIFVAPRSSPLDVADAIEEASQLSVIPSPDLPTASAMSWDATIDATWDLYEAMLDAPHLSERDFGATELLGISSQLDAGRLATPTPLGYAHSPAGAASWWPTRGRAEHRASGERRWP
jgi:hypothetical protein